MPVCYLTLWSSLFQISFNPLPLAFIVSVCLVAPLPRPLIRERSRSLWCVSSMPLYLLLCFVDSISMAYTVQSESQHFPLVDSQHEYVCNKNPAIPDWKLHSHASHELKTICVWRADRYLTDTIYFSLFPRCKFRSSCGLFALGRHDKHMDERYCANIRERELIALSLFFLGPPFFLLQLLTTDLRAHISSSVTLSLSFNWSVCSNWSRLSGEGLSVTAHLKEALPYIMLHIFWRHTHTHTLKYADEYRTKKK